MSAADDLARVLVHVPDVQICGVYPDGTTIRGNHIKHLVGALLLETATLQSKCDDLQALVDAEGWRP